MPCKVLELTQHRWYVVRGTWYVVRGAHGRRDGTTRPFPRTRAALQQPLWLPLHTVVYSPSLSKINDSRNSSSPALCLSQICAGPGWGPSCCPRIRVLAKREEERGFFVLISVCKRACKVLPGHRSKRGEYMPPSFMCSLALPADCRAALALALALAVAGLLTPRPALLRKLSSQKSSP